MTISAPRFYYVMRVESERWLTDRGTWSGMYMLAEEFDTYDAAFTAASKMPTDGEEMIIFGDFGLIRRQ